MDIAQRQLDIAGVRTPVFDTGGDASEAVVFVHGNPGSGRDWLGLMAHVKDFARAVAPDMPGFGTAAKPHDFDYTVAGYAAHIETLLARIGVEKVHLVLHDFGGAWGLAWAAANSSRVTSLSLINIGVLKGYRWHYLARIWRTPILGEVVQATTTRPAFHLLLKHGNPRGLPGEFVDGMYDNFDRETRRTVLKLYRATNHLDETMEQISTALRPLDLDVLVLWGKRDPYIPHRFAEQQRQTFPKAEIVYFEDSGHWPFIDNPGATADHVVRFLRRCVSGANAA